MSVRFVGKVGSDCDANPNFSIPLAIGDDNAPYGAEVRVLVDFLDFAERLLLGAA